MPLQELLIKQMADLTEEINKEGLKKKIDLSQNLIALLYIYLKRLGLSDAEMTAYYNSLSKKEK